VNRYGNNVCDQIWVKNRDLVHYRVWSLCYGRVYSQVGGQVWSRVLAQTHNHLRSPHE
jgi:hypothetical protein